MYFLYPSEIYYLFSSFQQDFPFVPENPPEEPMATSDESTDENHVNSDSSACSEEKEERFSQVLLK